MNKFKYCSNCGKKILSSTKFCPYCGAKQSNRTRLNTQPMHTMPKKNHGQLKFIVSAIIVLLLVIMGSLYIKGNNSSTSNNSASQSKVESKKSEKRSTNPDKDNIYYKKPIKNLRVKPVSPEKATPTDYCPVVKVIRNIPKKNDDSPTNMTTHKDLLGKPVGHVTTGDNVKIVGHVYKGYKLVAYQVKYHGQICYANPSVLG